MRRSHSCIYTHLFIFIVLLVAGPALYAQSYKVFTIAGTGDKGSTGDGAPAVCATLDQPQGTAVDLYGNVYIAANKGIRKVDGATGIITKIPATAGTNPYGVCVDGNDDLYFTDYVNSLIYKVSAATGSLTTIAGKGTGSLGDGGPAIAATMQRPTGIAVDGNGNIYFCDAGNSRIRRIDAVTGIITTIAGTGVNDVSSGDGGPAVSASTPFPEAICVDQAGNVYEGELQVPSTSRVRKIDMTTGIITTIAGTNKVAAGGDGGPAVAASLRGPSGLCMDLQGNLYIDEKDSGTLRKVDAVTGIITTIAGQDLNVGFNGDGAALSTTFNGPVGICVDAAGNLYVADVGNQRVRKVYSGESPPYPYAAIQISGNGSICAGSTPSFTATASFAGPRPVYQWERNGVAEGDNSAVYAPATFNNGDIIVCLLIPYQTTCTLQPPLASNKITILIGPPVTPSVSISADPAQVCTGSKVTFTPLPAGAGPQPSYQWSLNGNPVASGPTWSATTFQNGDIIGCRMQVDPAAPCVLATSAISNNITLSVKSVPAPFITITSNTKGVCQGDPESFQAAAGNAGGSPSYQWLFNGVAVAGNNTAYTDNNPVNGNKVNCRMIPSETDCPLPSGLLSDTLVETVNPLPVMIFNPPSFSIGAGQQVQLNATLSGTDIQSYEWSPVNFLTNPSSLTPLTIPLTSTTVFQLQATAVNGCSSTGNIVVQLLGKFRMPGAFTPNGDGRNDVFRIPPNTWFTLEEMSVYNRWGVKIFSTRNIGEGWDGTYGGHPSPAGVYVYTISGTEGSKPVFVKGTVVLVR